jgi:hypothetical protein
MRRTFLPLSPSEYVSPRIGTHYEEHFGIGMAFDYFGQSVDGVPFLGSIELERGDADVRFAGGRQSKHCESMIRRCRFFIRLMRSMKGGNEYELVEPE